MVSYDSLKEHQTELIRKATTGSVFIADATVATITTLTTHVAGPPVVHDLTPLPAGYEDLGYLTDDGVAFATDTTSSDITSWQSTSPTRSDITAETSTVNVTAQETKLKSLSLYTGALSSGIEGAVTTGDVIIKKPERPSSRFYRLLSLSVDENEFGEIYIARYLPRAKVTSKGEQGYSKADQAIVWPVTFTGFYDSTYGSSETFLFGGPGWLALLDEMGIPQAV